MRILVVLSSHTGTADAYQTAAVRLMKEHSGQNLGLYFAFSASTVVSVYRANSCDTAILHEEAVKSNGASLGDLVTQLRDAGFAGSITTVSESSCDDPYDLILGALTAPASA